MRRGVDDVSPGPGARADGDLDRCTPSAAVSAPGGHCERQGQTTLVSTYSNTRADNSGDYATESARYC
jgi:hypothetical protein